MNLSRTFKWDWAHVDESRHASEFVEALDARRPDDDPAHFPASMVWIDAHSGERILEVGCGNGAVARAVARHVPSVREIVAVDASEAMIAAARRQMLDRELPVTFQVADAHSLPFADDTFERVYAMETFVILGEPERALREMMRVTRPCGVVCINEADHDSNHLLTTDLELGRRVQRFVAEHEYNGAVPRQIIGWLKEAGWQVRYEAAVGAGEELSPTHEASIRAWLRDAQAAGVVTAQEAEAFLADLRERAASGTYLSYGVAFRIAAIKPDKRKAE